MINEDQSQAASITRRLVALTAVFLVLAGCGSSGGPSALNLHAFQSNAASASNSLTASGMLPMQQYLLRGQDFQTVDLAVRILAQQCMAKQGFTSFRFPPQPPLSMFDKDLRYRRYGVESMADATTYGYRIPPADNPRQNAADAPSLSTAETNALMGSQVASASSHYRNGCYGAADHELMGPNSSLDADGLTASPIVDAVIIDPKAVISPESIADRKVFAQCMSAAGYSGVTDPRDVPTFVLASSHIGPPSKAEIVASQTQYRCQQSSGVTDAMYKAEVAFELKAVDANPTAFAQIKSQIAALLRRATTIVSRD